jgi:hypothetical protein
MNKITRVLGTTLAGAALVGGSAVAANAHGGHHGFGGDHTHSAPTSGPFSAASAEHKFAGFSRHHDEGEGHFNLGPSFNHRWFHHYSGHHHHWTFEERQAAIVAQLTRADDRLTTLIGYLSDQAKTDPNGWEAQALPYLKAQQARLETLLTAVKAATNDDQLKAAFKAAFPKPTPTPAPTTAPSTAPSTAPTTTPTTVPSVTASPAV